MSDVDTFYLGIHRAYWLSRPELADVPVFLSRNVFPKGRFQRAAGRYAIDSGGFTELQHYGGWTIGPAEYVTFLRRAWSECGPFDFAAPQDWMCEPVVIDGGQVGDQMFVGTGLDVVEHQRRTVANLLELRTLAPDLPIVPVIQGWVLPDYLRCIDMYSEAGVDLTAEPLVAVGTLCRRQGMAEAAQIIDAIRDRGITRLHGFGFKIEGLRACWSALETADSLSWSRDGRHAGPCQHPPYSTGRQPKSEANCLAYALGWVRRHIHPPTRPVYQQLDLMGALA